MWEISTYSLTGLFRLLLNALPNSTTPAARSHFLVVAELHSDHHRLIIFVEEKANLLEIDQLGVGRIGDCGGGFLGDCVFPADVGELHGVKVPLHGPSGKATGLRSRN
jgi:hypothetical protein